MLAAHPSSVLTGLHKEYDTFIKHVRVTHRHGPCLDQAPRMEAIRVAREGRPSPSKTSWQASSLDHHQPHIPLYRCCSPFASSVLVVGQPANSYPPALECFLDIL
eukprot:TRINITY_DN11361_c0_g1_i1.p1 TRINITY_DN11361_c0_g1~~TRINITY_DN11361_c0_g1_i1.p1  ORF type:complete len:105 (+),score=8.77 TRINITY_DN11361_c0_g1_i1:135-449(+)